MSLNKEEQDFIYNWDSAGHGYAKWGEDLEPTLLPMCERLVVKGYFEKISGTRFNGLLNEKEDLQMNEEALVRDGKYDKAKSVGEHTFLHITIRCYRRSSQSPIKIFHPFSWFTNNADTYIGLSNAGVQVRVQLIKERARKIKQSGYIPPDNRTTTLLIGGVYYEM